MTGPLKKGTFCGFPRMTKFYVVYMHSALNVLRLWLKNSVDTTYFKQFVMEGFTFELYAATYIDKLIFFRSILTFTSFLRKCYVNATSLIYGVGRGRQKIFVCASPGNIQNKVFQFGNRWYYEYLMPCCEVSYLLYVQEVVTHFIL